jgi:hypothetical protein
MTRLMLIQIYIFIVHMDSGTFSFVTIIINILEVDFRGFISNQLSLLDNNFRSDMKSRQKFHLMAAVHSTCFQRRPLGVRCAPRQNYFIMLSNNQYFVYFS